MLLDCSDSTFRILDFMFLQVLAAQNRILLPQTTFIMVLLSTPIFTTPLAIANRENVEGG